MNPVDAHLDDVTVKQLVWKPEPHRHIAGTIVRVALAGGGMVKVWPDQVELNVATGDTNCIGTAWRYLARLGVLATTGDWRRSKSKTANGRKVFAYKLASVALAKRWLKANGLEQPAGMLKQSELAMN